MDSSDEAWRALRALRSNPPGNAKASSLRRATFCAALEQSEQLFDAARAVGYQARPLPLFYALSQAGRAIAASVGDDESWQLRGHGITASDPAQFWKIKVRNHGAGAFTALGAMLDSATLPQTTDLGHTWLAIPDTFGAQAEPGEYPALEVLPELDDGTPIARIDPNFVVAGIPDHIVDKNAPDSNKAATEFLRHYPALRGCYIPPTASAGLPTRAWGERTGLTLRVQTSPEEIGGGVYASDKIQAIGSSYVAGDDRRWIFPATEGDDRPLHPLLAWWATLLALSWLARYEPAAWVSELDVDSSPNATAIEALLDLGLSTLPAVICQTMLSACAV